MKKLPSYIDTNAMKAVLIHAESVIADAGLPLAADALTPYADQSIHNFVATPLREALARHLSESDIHYGKSLTDASAQSDWFWIELAHDHPFIEHMTTEDLSDLMYWVARSPEMLVGVMVKIAAECKIKLDAPKVTEDQIVLSVNEKPVAIVRQCSFTDVKSEDRNGVSKALRNLKRGDSHERVTRRFQKALGYKAGHVGFNRVFGNSDTDYFMFSSLSHLCKSFQAAIGQVSTETVSLADVQSVVCKVFGIPNWHVAVKLEQDVSKTGSVYLITDRTPDDDIAVNFWLRDSLSAYALYLKVAQSGTREKPIEFVWDSMSPLQPWINRNNKQDLYDMSGCNVSYAEVAEEHFDHPDKVREQGRRFLATGKADASQIGGLHPESIYSLDLDGHRFNVIMMFDQTYLKSDIGEGYLDVSEVLVSRDDNDVLHWNIAKYGADDQCFMNLDRLSAKGRFRLIDELGLTLTFEASDAKDAYEELYEEALANGFRPKGSSVLSEAVVQWQLKHRIMEDEEEEQGQG